jgi:hypothetical protein
MIFFVSVAPLTILGAEKSAGQIYLNNATDTGEQVGFLPNTVTGLTMLIVGAVPDSSSATTSSSGNTYQEYKGGALQALSSYSDAMYSNQPASFIVWAQDQYYQVRGATSFAAMAATIPNPNDSSNYSPGIGYNLLQPVMGLSNYARNIVYGVYIVIMIVLAFVIMLRRPLGGQELVTIANSLPSLIISIVLVTFSYPICGLFIDGVYIGSNLAYNILFVAEGSPGESLTRQVVKQDELGDIARTNNPTTGEIEIEKIDIQNVLQPDDPQMSIWSIMNLSGSGICNNPGIFPEGALGSGSSEEQCQVGFIIPKEATNNFLGKVVNNIAGQLDTTIAQKGASVLIELILALAIFQTALKLFFSILNSYLTLSLYPIIAPFVFLGAALPNNLNKTLDSFFKTLGAAALNLIAIYACFLLLVLFGQTASSVDASKQYILDDNFKEAGQIKWVPPLLGYNTQQISDLNSLQNGENGGNIITTILIFGLYMAIPNISEMIKKMLEVASPFQQLAQTKGDVLNVGKQAMGVVGSGVKMITSTKLPG